MPANQQIEQIEHFLIEDFKSIQGDPLRDSMLFSSFSCSAALSSLNTLIMRAKRSLSAYRKASGTFNAFANFFAVAGSGECIPCS